MSDAQAKLDALLTAKRVAREKPGEPVRCDVCKEAVSSPCYGYRRARPHEAIPFCFPHWLENQTLKGEDKWWLKPEFRNAEEVSRASRPKRSRRTSRRD